MTKTTIALIPAYEPDDILFSVVRELLPFAAVVVIDDGSGDDYLPLFDKLKSYAIVLHHSANKGKGCALKTGLSYIRQNMLGDVIVTVDADGQHSLSDTLAVARKAEEHPGSLILGCRSFSGKVPLRSRLGNSLTRLVYRMSTGITVNDTQTGLRAFTRDLIPVFEDIKGDRYEYEMNVLLECARKNVPIIGTEIATLYYNGNSGSHFHPLRDSLRVSETILKFTASSLASFCVDYGLFSLFSVLTAGFGAGSIVLSNVSARVFSAGFNYTINKKYIFHSKDSVIRTGLSYFLLSVCILAGNTVMLSLLVNTLGLNRFAAKILTELTFFLISWTAQRFVIFPKQEKTITAARGVKAAVR